MKGRGLHFMCLPTLLAVALIGPLALFNHDARPEDARTIKIVVPSPPGGVVDFLARLLSDQIGRSQGLTSVIDNRPGAAEVIGTESVARAAPDGNTLLIAGPPFVINPNLRKVNYHPLTSFEPICHLVSSPSVISVNGASPYRTLGELLEAARARPGTLTLASQGPGSPSQIWFEEVKRVAKIDMTFVPFPGGGPAVNALLGEHVTSVFGPYSNVAEYLKTGRLRALAAATRTRIEPLPELPTVVEAGFNEVDIWFGILAPAKTPQEKVSQFARWFTAAMQIPEVKAKLAVQGLYPVGTCGEDFGAYLRKQYDDYGRVIREANIKAE